MQQGAQMNAMMEGQFNESMAQHQQMMMMQQMEWARAQEEMKLQEWKMQQQFENISLQQEAENWKNEALMEQGFAEAKLTYEEEQKNIHDSSSSMLETMMNDPDPRFQNSQFLHFLKRINKGEIKIEGKEIREVQPDLEAMDKAWSEAELVHQSNLANLDPAFQEAKLKEA